MQTSAFGRAKSSPRASVLAPVQVPGFHIIIQRPRTCLGEEVRVGWKDPPLHRVVLDAVALPLEALPALTKGRQGFPAVQQELFRQGYLANVLRGARRCGGGVVVVVTLCCTLLQSVSSLSAPNVLCITSPPPPSNERSERLCSLDPPFGARDNIVKRWEHIPGHKIPSPFNAPCNGGLQLALFRVQSLVVVPVHVEKLNMLPGPGARFVLGMGRSGSPVHFGMDSSPVWYRLYGSSRPGAGRESVIVGNRGPAVEGHHSLTTCSTNLPTITARYITPAAHSPKPLT